jgi:hypothetical protein
VVRPEYTNRRSFELMRDLLERSGVRPRGIIILGDNRPLTSGYYEYEDVGDPVRASGVARLERSGSRTRERPHGAGSRDPRFGIPSRGLG